MQPEDRDEVRTRTRPKQVAVQLPPIAQVSEAPVLLKESENDATKKPQIAPTTVDKTDQPALSENIHQILPPIANQKQGQNKETQLAQGTSLEIVHGLEKKLANVSSTKEEEIRKAVEEAKQEIEIEYRAQKSKNSMNWYKLSEENS